MKIRTRDMILVALFAALACLGGLLIRLGGEMIVPFSILPLIVMFAGALLGARLGALSFVVYLLIGLVGIPVFAQPPYGGLAYIFQPTFGFLIGFIFGAYTVGSVVKEKENPGFGWYFFAMCGGLAVIYVCGLIYLYMMLNFYVGKAVSVWGVMKIGFLPFILFDLLKVLIAAAIARPTAERIKAATQS